LTDFEGALKFFRVQLPKRYRSEENAKKLMELACSMKISQKKLKKYEKEYHTMREQQAQQEDPIERFEVCLLMAWVDVKSFHFSLSFPVIMPVTGFAEFF